jgi:hypothetical protein
VLSDEPVQDRSDLKEMPLAHAGVRAPLIVLQDGVKLLANAIERDRDDEFDGIHDVSPDASAAPAAKPVSPVIAEARSGVTDLADSLAGRRRRRIGPEVRVGVVAD